MPNLARHSYNVAVVAGTVVIAGLNLTIQYLDALKSLAPWLVALLSAGVIGGMYKSMLYLYEKRLWRKISGKPVLSGRWKHTLFPTDAEPTNDRKGEFEVSQDAFDIKFVGGKNLDQKTGLYSFWHSLAIFDDQLSEKCLWVIYQIDRGRVRENQGAIDRGLLIISCTSPWTKEAAQRRCRAITGMRAYHNTKANSKHNLWRHESATSAASVR